jgi:hypothetical protein
VSLVETEAAGKVESKPSLLFLEPKSFALTRNSFVPSNRKEKTRINGGGFFKIGGARPPLQNH